MLLARAKDAMKNARYVEARGLCQTLIQSHPNSEYVPLAKLSIADAWYAEGNLKQAEVEYRDFLTFFPDRREVAEVQAKLASMQAEQKSPR
jgi:outer membrane protein assembly factor BamD